MKSMFHSPNCRDASWLPSLSRESHNQALLSSPSSPTSRCCLQIDVRCLFLLNEEIWVLVLVHLLKVKAVLEHHFACLSKSSYDGIPIDGRHQPFSKDSTIRAFTISISQNNPGLGLKNIYTYPLCLSMSDADLTRLGRSRFKRRLNALTIGATFYN